MPIAASPAAAQRRVIVLTGILFVSYLTVAMALPTVPIEVHDRLGLDNALGGLAVGLPFLTTLLTRAQAGRLADERGGRRCMLRGLGVYTVASAICMAAAVPATPHLRFAVLLAGRALLGVGESQVAVGMIGWGIGLMGHARSGKVIALVGAGMYGALAVGGPLGLALFRALGFAGLMATCTLLSVLGAAIAFRFPDAPPTPGQRQPLWRVVRRIALPGAAVGLQGIGFAALGAFMSLDFLSKGWPGAGLGLTCFGIGFVLMRLAFGDLPDRVGGTAVAAGSLLVEATGQYLIWLAPEAWVALLGALLTGLGCSMVFPSMGKEAIRRVEPHLRGTAIGGFAAFQDLAYGATGPVVGLLADRTGYASVFLIGGIAATLGIGAALLAHRGARGVAG